MNIDELKKSSFLKRSDVAKPFLATIDRAEFVNVAKEGAPEELKRCLYFKELEKPMVMNGTNLEIIAKITGDRDDDHWGGHKVVLYDDPNVSFGGKLVGGIRVRAPRTPVARVGATNVTVPQPARRPDDPKPMGSFLPPIVPTDQRAVEAGEDIDPENPY